MAGTFRIAADAPGAARANEESSTEATPVPCGTQAKNLETKPKACRMKLQCTDLASHAPVAGCWFEEQKLGFRVNPKFRGKHTHVLDAVYSVSKISTTSIQGSTPVATPRCPPLFSGTRRSKRVYAEAQEPDY